MTNAEKYSCKVLVYPNDPQYDEKIRRFQGCPTIASTKGGRLFAGWYSGGTCEPHMDNYNILAKSDDGGQTWSKPIVIIPSSKELLIHALDIQLFMDSQDRLHVAWVQDNTSKDDSAKDSCTKYRIFIGADGYYFSEQTHYEWEIICENPDEEVLTFSQPQLLCQGFLRCKPTTLKNGDIIMPAYDQLTDNYGYSISHDGGKTYKHYYGAQKVMVHFDEGMAYQLEDDSVRMLYRAKETGFLAESSSYDNGLTWTPTKNSDIVAPDTRFYVEKLPSGRVLLVVNDHPSIRKNMTIKLSEDDGKTWKYSVCIDERENISYPDATYFEGRIYLVYDRGRTTDKEILFTSFTENDIINGTIAQPRIISKP